MECPKCHGEMEEVTYGRNMTIDRCTNCKGIWFDVGEAEALKGKWMSEFVDSGDPDIGKEFNKIEDVSLLNGLTGLKNLTLAYNQLVDVSPLSETLHVVEVLRDHYCAPLGQDAASIRVTSAERRSHPDSVAMDFQDR